MIVCIELHKLSQDRRHDGTEDFTYTNIPLLLLLTSKRYGECYPSKTNWAEEK